VPSHIILDPVEEGVKWWIKYDILYYDGGNEEYQIPMPNLWDGDYKRPETVVEEEEYYSSDEEDESSVECESACECSDCNERCDCNPNKDGFEWICRRCAEIMNARRPHDEMPIEALEAEAEAEAEAKAMEAEAEAKAVEAVIIQQEIQNGK